MEEDIRLTGDRGSRIISVHLGTDSGYGSVIYYHRIKRLCSDNISRRYYAYGARPLGPLYMQVRWCSQVLYVARRSTGLEISGK